MMGIIRAHGGRLVRRMTGADTGGMHTVHVPQSTASDIENVADGIFSPLEGFLGREDFESVVSRGRLAGDVPWTIPIVLDMDKAGAERARDSGDILLKGDDGLSAVMHVEEIFRFDREELSAKVYGTTDPAHPGVARTASMREFLVGGGIEMVERPRQAGIRRYRMTPDQTRQAFEEAGWKSIVAFQTRNPPHVAHEMLQKTAITTRDGVFVNPLVGKKKSGDFVDEVIVECYESMIRNYYPENRCRLATLHTEMRYAGPKEAIHHAIMRQNYGCTHIIIGRDHAGVGSYYDPFAAHAIFGDYPDLEITPIFFPAFFYCRRCLTFTNHRACPHGAEDREQVSGTKLRAMIQGGTAPNEFIMRPQVSKIILDHPAPFVP